MKLFLIVFAGGGLGSVVRFYLSQWVTIRTASSFPWGTLTSNVLACVMLGLAVSMADQKMMLGANARLFWTVGFCGGFSTFSTFSAESVTLLQSGLTLSMSLYMIMSVMLCLLAVMFGLWAGRLL